MTSMYVKLNNSHQPTHFPYSLAEFRSDNPGTSFPVNISDETLAEYAVHPVTATAVPTFDSKTHKVNQTAELKNNVWTQVWTVLQLEEARASENIRGHRNSLLKETDYTQLTDAPGDAAVWATYRQALRDIPAQEGFPFTVTWPTEPS